MTDADKRLDDSIAGLWRILAARGSPPVAETSEAPSLGKMLDAIIANPAISPDATEAAFGLLRGLNARTLARGPFAELAGEPTAMLPDFGQTEFRELEVRLFALRGDAVAVWSEADAAWRGGGAELARKVRLRGSVLSPADARREFPEAQLDMLPIAGLDARRAEAAGYYDLEFSVAVIAALASIRRDLGIA